MTYPLERPTGRLSVREPGVRPGFLSAAAMTALVVSACSGHIGTPPGEGPGGGKPGTTTPIPGTGNPEVDQGAAVAKACNRGPVKPGRSPLRRLTVRQYNNSIRDLFPGVTLPAQSFSDDTTAHGFSTNAETQTLDSRVAEDYLAAATNIATVVVDTAPAGTLCSDPANAKACGAEMIAKVGARAFRRPLADDEKMTYVTFFEGQLAAANFKVAASLTIAALLQDPQFLYLVELGTGSGSGDVDPLTPHELAARMSYLLWGSIPDGPLLDAAARNQLTSREQIEAQARRMLADPRARDTVVAFHREWMDARRLDLSDSQKDQKAFPMWTAELRSAMLEEQDRFVQSVLEGEGTLGALLTSPASFVNPSLAALYGVKAPASGWAPASLDGATRAGLLTRAGFLSAHSRTVHPSPVARGVFVLDRLLCAPAPPPPPNVADNIPQAVDGLTTTNRQRYAAHEEFGSACSVCHGAIDSIGFTFEIYDALGRYRTTDNARPVDASGRLTTEAGTVPIRDAVDLSQALAKSSNVRLCVTEQWFRYAFGYQEESADACTLAALDASMAGSGGNIRELLVAIVTSEAFTHRVRSR